MSSWNPQLADWVRRGLDWQYIDQSIIRIFEIPANGQFQLPVEGHTFRYPEGMLLEFSAGFDHPKCGIRIESDPEFDTAAFFTVETALLGLTRPEILVYGVVPPVMPPGIFGIRIVSSWSWQSWLRLYLINTDSVPHRAIGHSYHMAVLRRPRPASMEELLGKLLDRLPSRAISEG